MWPHPLTPPPRSCVALPSTELTGRVLKAVLTLGLGRSASLQEQWPEIRRKESKNLAIENPAHVTV